MTTSKGSSPLRVAAVLLTLAWLCLIALQAWHRWPHVPLDMGSSDAATLEIYRETVQKHIVRALVLAVAVPAVIFGLIALVQRRQRPSAPIAVTSRPARVLLMRHAEKTDDPDDYHLSPAGRLRAEKLASYIPATFGKPDAIFVARRSKRSNRSVETMEPLSSATGVEIDTTYDDDKPKALIARLLGDHDLAGKTVVVCWHHSDLIKLARALGAPEESIPNDWDEGTFNLILDLRAGADGSVTARQVVQPF